MAREPGQTNPNDKVNAAIMEQARSGQPPKKMFDGEQTSLMRRVSPGVSPGFEKDAPGFATNPTNQPLTSAPSQVPGELGVANSTYFGMEPTPLTGVANVDLNPPLIKTDTPESAIMDSNVPLRADGILRYEKSDPNAGVPEGWEARKVYPDPKDDIFLNNGKTVYSGPGGSSMEVIGGIRKGEGTLSVMPGPGSSKYTDEQWASMSSAEKQQANAAAHAEIGAVIGSAGSAGSRALTGDSGGGGGSSGMDAYERERIQREYGMAIGNLQDDMRYGRISSKKGAVLASLMKDKYGSMLGITPEQETDRELMKSRILADRTTTTNSNRAPQQRFSAQQIGDDDEGGKQFGIVDQNTGRYQPITGPKQSALVEAQTRFAKAAAGSPEALAAAADIKRLQGAK